MKIWTDGGCHPNPGAGGWGYVRSDGKEVCGGEQNTTNNRMEMTAVLRALSELPNGSSVTVYSDSQYCVKGLTIWRAGWRKKKWLKEGKPMLNQDLWLALEVQMNRLQVDMQWVKGHAGDVNNEKADSLATQGRLNALCRQADAMPLIEAKKLTASDLRDMLAKAVDDTDSAGTHKYSEMRELQDFMEYVDEYFA